jgi:hypothetical protein
MGSSPSQSHLAGSIGLLGECPVASACLKCGRAFRPVQTEGAVL